jgi:hypothetical protein
LLSSKLATLGFAIFLTLAAYRAYQYPGYTSDMFLYMANAVAMHGDDIQAIHDTVYQEVLTEIPKPALDHLLGNDPVETSQSRSFHERAVNPYRFAEFLPCFAVRPVFNELVYVLHYRLGIGLLRATVLISVASYWVLGWIVFTWISRYVAEPWAALVSTLLMLTPPIWDLARWPMPDALSCLVLLSGLYALLEMKRVVLGLTILMASVYVRTDNVLLVLSVLAYLSILNHTIEKAKAAVLAALAIGSVFVINHFAGDYGARLLYYRAFIAPPVAPGELVAHFGFHDYVVALRAGVAEVLHGDFIAFALMGVVGLLKRPTSAILGLVIVTVAYSTSRFVIFPLVEGRYFGLFFLVMGISLVSTLLARHAPPLRQTASALNIAREPVER